MDSKLLMYAALGIGGYILFQKYVAKKVNEVASQQIAQSNQGINLESELNKLGRGVIDKVKENLDILDGSPSYDPRSYLNQYLAANSEETKFAGYHCG